MNRLILLTIFIFALAGCASNSSVDTDTPELKLDYHTQVSNPENGKIIAIASYQFLTNNAAETAKSDSTVFGIKLAGRSLPFSAITTYHEKYETTLHKAVQSSLTEMISKRGFTPKGPFKTSDQIPYTDRKNFYLIIQPRLNLNIEQHVISTECVHSVCSEVGVITLSGDVFLRFLEPLTEQTLMIKQSDFNGLHVRKNYVHQYPQLTHTAVMQGLHNTKSTSLVDDADKELVNVINEFFQTAMADTDKLISAQELLSHQSDLDKMRDFKRN